MGATPAGNGRGLNEIPKTTGPLSGVRVLDIAGFAPVKFGTMIMADLGAEVIQIERPHSTYPDAFELMSSDAHPRWLWYSRNKLTLSVNLQHPRGKEIVDRLIERSDILMEGNAVGTAQKLGVDYETARAINPRLIYCSVSGFGQSGDYSSLWGHEPNYQAMAGLMSLAGAPDTGPSIVGVPVGDCTASMYAVIGVLAALRERDRTGNGAYLDVAIHDALISLLGAAANYFWLSGFDGPRQIPEFGGSPAAQMYRTYDQKYIVTSAIEPWAWRKLCMALGRPDLVADGESAERSGERRLALESIFAEQTREAWIAFNREHNVGISPVLELSEVLSDPHVRERGMIQEIARSDLGPTGQVSTPIRISGQLPTVDWLPRHSEHTTTVLSDLGYDPSAIDELRNTGIVE
jgi:crotonobetainyl-CoA:carnitine CoA-transferase CaiB-like acyl-CoA transferase